MECIWYEMHSNHRDGMSKAQGLGAVAQESLRHQSPNSSKSLYWRDGLA